MRVAVVSDVHGNLSALEAVIADLRVTAPDLICHGGDLATGGPRPAEVLDRIRDLGWPGVCGNTDEMLWDPRGVQDLARRVPALSALCRTLDRIGSWTSERIGDDRLRWLQTLPLSLRRDGFALVHASPESLWKSPLADATDSELEETYKPLNANVVVYGHIHRPFVRIVNGLTIANSGSVSLSYDGDTRASYAIVDDGRVQIRRVEYDVEREATLLLKSDFPEAAWQAQILRAGAYVPPQA